MAEGVAGFAWAFRPGDDVPVALREGDAFAAAEPFEALELRKVALLGLWLLLLEYIDAPVGEVDNPFAGTHVGREVDLDTAVLEFVRVVSVEVVFGPLETFHPGLLRA